MFKKVATIVAILCVLPFSFSFSQDSEAGIPPVNSNSWNGLERCLSVDFHLFKLSNKTEFILSGTNFDIQQNDVSIGFYKAVFKTVPSENITGKLAIGCVSGWFPNRDDALLLSAFLEFANFGIEKLDVFGQYDIYVNDEDDFLACFGAKYPLFGMKSKHDEPIKAGVVVELLETQKNFGIGTYADYNAFSFGLEGYRLVKDEDKDNWSARMIASYSIGK